jgi:uncharacterized protein YjdB
MQNNLNHTFKKAAVLVLSAMLFFVSIPVSAATTSQAGNTTTTAVSAAEDSLDSDVETEDTTEGTTESDTQTSSSTVDNSGTSGSSSTIANGEDSSTSDVSASDGSGSSGTDDSGTSDSSVSGSSGASDAEQSTDSTQTTDEQTSDLSSAEDTSASDAEDQDASSEEDSEEVTSSSSSSDETTNDEDPLPHRNAADFEDSSSSGIMRLFSSSTSGTPTLPSKYKNYNVTKGIDVSQFQGDINWTKVKNAGISFVIIRVGYSGYGSGAICEDSKAIENLKEAKAAGLKVGAYYFSQAIKTSEAVNEAKKSIEVLKESGVSLDLPMFIDYEYISDSDGAGRLQAAKNNGLSKSTMTSIVKAFCAKVSASGYKAGVYANKSMLEDDLNYSDIQSSYTVWLAHWTTSATDYAGDFSFWQYSGDSGKATVSGISGTVDLDIRLTKNVKMSASVDTTAYVQKEGWTSTVSDGETAGTTGEGLRLEAFKVKINSKNYSGSSISYTSYVEGAGWQSYVSNGATSGTTGQKKKIEAVRIKLSGTIASDYDIWYRVHVQHIGWMSWTSNNSIAGTTGMDYRVEAIQVALVPKGDGAPANTNASTTLSYLTNPGVSYQTYVQKKGWTSAVKNGATSGTVGQSLRVEAIKINASASGLGVSYRSYLAGTGWESSWKSSGGTSGTTGQKRRMEAIQIKLTGAASSYLNVYYRVYVQKVGWLGWAKNGATAGTTDCSLRVEAIQIEIRSKTDGAPSDTGSVLSASSLSTKDVQYRAYVQGTGWQSTVENGETAGTENKSLRVEAVEISTNVPGLGVEYRTHIQGSGWESTWHSSGKSGTTGKKLRLEAIQIRLTGEASKYFDIYYRAHVQNFGWLGWAKNGESAGSQGYSYRMEALQIVICLKGQTPGSTANAFKKTNSDFASRLNAASTYDRLIIVQCSGTQCTLTMHKKGSDGLMTEILSTSGWIGKNGLGTAREGVAYTPKGIFEPDIALGIKADPGCGIDYHQVDESDYWDGDSESSMYNRLVSTDTYTDFDKSVSEHLINMGSVYDYILNIGYNSSCTPYAGSAFFLHVTSGRPTGGCVAIPEEDMITVLQNVTSNTAIIIDTESGVMNY